MLKAFLKAKETLENMPPPKPLGSFENPAVMYDWEYRLLKQNVETIEEIPEKRMVKYLGYWYMVPLINFKGGDE